MIRLKVREIAAQKHMSQGKLARAADIDENTLRRIYREPYNTNITLITLDKLALALGVDASELIESVTLEQPTP